MAHLQVLIVEDNLLLALDLESLVRAVSPSSVSIATSLREAEDALGEEFDFVFLDVNLREGNTFGLARRLVGEGVTVAFVTSISHNQVEPELQHLPFIPKPAQLALIESVLLAA